MDIHGVLRPVVHVQGEGVIVWTVDVGQDERLLVFRFRVHRCDVVFVRVAYNLAEKWRRRHVWSLPEEEISQQLTVNGESLRRSLNL